MKKILFLLLLYIVFHSTLQAQNTLIPDPNFEQALIDLGYDAAPVDGYVPTANISNVTSLKIENKNISDLTGIEGFSSLTELRCGYNNLTSLTLSSNTLLQLGCNNNKLTNLTVKNCPLLYEIHCEENLLAQLDVTNNTEIIFLFFTKNLLTSIDVSKNYQLINLDGNFNLLNSLDLTNCINLEFITCSNNRLTTISIPDLPKLFYVNFSYNLLTVANIECKGILILNLGNNQLSVLDVTACSSLDALFCNNNKLYSLNLRNGNIAALRFITAKNNLPWLCIQTDDATVAIAKALWEKDPTANYDNYCTPTITSFLPTSVCPGQTVTITGTNLNVATAVSFGGIPAQSFTILSASKIIAIPAAGASGDVSVTTPAGTASLNGFAFNPAVVPSVTVQSSTLNSCPGTLLTFTALPFNEGATPSYEWTVNNIITGSNSPVYTSTTLQTGDIVKVKMTSSAVCAAPVTVTSNNTRIVLGTIVTPVVTISTLASTICEGTAVTFTANPNNGGSSPSYQWKVNGNNTGTNAATFTTNLFAHGDIITVQMTSSEACAAPPTVVSNAIPISVTPALPVSVTIAGNASACAGTAVTFTATGINGGSSPAYQWQVNGVNTGTNSPIFTTTGLSNSDLVKVIMSSGTGCITGSPAISNTITMNISPTVTPMVSILADKTTICAGTPVVFTATPSNGGSNPHYEWKINGNTTGSNSPTFTTSSLGQGDKINVIMNSNATCAINPAVSGNITMLVNNSVRPQVKINALTPGPICYGTEVIIAATTVDEGNAPIYQWKVNGMISGNNSPVFTSRNLVHGDIINCTLISNAACVSNSTILSNDIIIAINTAQCPEGFYMPSAFSPNNDGKNDIAKPTIYGNVKEYQLTIFDRWGHKVFESKDLQKGWNGELSGRNTGTGVYIWQCSFRFEGKENQVRKGTITLVR